MSTIDYSGAVENSIYSAQVADLEIALLIQFSQNGSSFSLLRSKLHSLNIGFCSYAICFTSGDLAGCQIGIQRSLTRAPFDLVATYTGIR